MHIGCAKKGKTEAAMPKWFLSQPELCGVGVAKMRGNMGAAKTTAENRARADLSQQLETSVESMITSYENEVGTAEGNFSEEETAIVSKSLSKQTLIGSIPQKHYISKPDAQFYSLVCLNPGVLTDAINQMTQLSDAQRNSLARRAQKLHEDLEKELETYDE